MCQEGAPRQVAWVQVPGCLSLACGPGHSASPLASTSSLLPEGAEVSEAGGPQSRS